MKTGIKLSKEGNLHSVGHLDVMRYSQKANRRTELPAVYSEGFHPHQIMSFAAPLGMNPEGKAECFDPRITEESAATLHSTEAVERLSQKTVEGIQILPLLCLPDDSLNYMSIVHTADYEALFQATTPGDKIVGQLVDSSAYRSLTGDKERSFRAVVDGLLQHKEIPVQKIGKKGNFRGLGLRSMIRTLRCEDNHLRCTVAQGSETNLRPGLLLSALFSLDTACSSAAMPHRMVHIELYDNAGKTLGSYRIIL